MLSQAITVQFISRAVVMVSAIIVPGWVAGNPTGFHANHQSSRNYRTFDNNVCKSIMDYATKTNNPNCWYNPDLPLEPNQIIRRHGYPLETHTVVTDDGYLLKVFRILPTRGSRSVADPVLLAHGIGLDSISWLFLGNGSLPFQLADRGFDVWLANFRGSRFSVGHTTFKMGSPQYWDFSFHELGVYDVPALAEYIGHHTAGRKITYVGHSMGSTVSYVFASQQKGRAEKHLSSIISLAPVSFLGNTKTAVRLLVPLRELITVTSRTFGVHVLGQPTNELRHAMGALCSIYPVISMCYILAAVLTGLELKEATPEVFPMFVRNYPQPISLKTLQHYAQVVTAKDHFPMFDYGSAANMQLYNCPTPPDYNITTISVPVHLFYGEKDLIAVTEDVKKLFVSLRTARTLHSTFSKTHSLFSHNDFIYGRNGGEFSKYLVDFIEQTLQSTASAA